MQSTSRTRRHRLATGLALGLTIALAGSATAVAAEPAAAAPAKKLERIAGKAGKKAAPTKQQKAAMKRDLKEAGVQTTAAPSGQKKMTRGICTLHAPGRYGQLGTCLNVGGPTGFYTNVFIDWFGDGRGWIYYGWYYS
jgi:hypothetical protein